MPKQTINPFRNFLCLLLFCLPRAHTVHHQLTDISRVQTAGLAKLSPMLLPASLLCRPCGAVAVVVIFNSCLREGTLFLSSSSFVCGGLVGRGCFLLVTPRGPQAAARSLCIVTKSDLIPSSHAVNFPSNKPSPGALQSQVAVVQRCSCWTFCGYFVVAYPQYVGVTVSGSARLSWLQLS